MLELSTSLACLGAKGGSEAVDMRLSLRNLEARKQTARLRRLPFVSSVSLHVRYICKAHQIWVRFSIRILFSISTERGFASMEACCGKPDLAILRKKQEITEAQ
jgi:hypothetical protein